MRRRRYEGAEERARNRTDGGGGAGGERGRTGNEEGERGTTREGECESCAEGRRRLTDKTMRGTAKRGRGAEVSPKAGRTRDRDNVKGQLFAKCSDLANS